MDDQDELQIEILDRVAIDDMVGKVAGAASLPGAAGEVERWRAEHGNAHHPPRARSFAVVGRTLMFLHPCPDGVVLPFAVYPDGTCKVYADPEHAGESFYPEDLGRPTFPPT